MSPTSTQPVSIARRTDTGSFASRTRHTPADLQRAGNRRMRIVPTRARPTEQRQDPIADHARDMAAMTAHDIERETAIAGKQFGKCLRLDAELVAGGVNHVAEQHAQKAVLG